MDDLITCDTCGGDIIIRWANGRPQKYHVGGSGGSASTTEAPAQYSGALRQASVAWSVGHARCDLGGPLTRPMICPICKEEIFFIRTAMAIVSSSMNWWRLAEARLLLDKRKYPEGVRISGAHGSR
jgi:hypothetical protein